MSSYNNRKWGALSCSGLATGICDHEMRGHYTKGCGLLRYPYGYAPAPSLTKFSILTPTSRVSAPRMCFSSFSPRRSGVKSASGIPRTSGFSHGFLPFWSTSPPTTRQRIYFYHKHDPYYGFTNFSPHSVVYQGKIYPTSEHLFQSFKVSLFYLFKAVTLMVLLVVPRPSSRFGGAHPNML